MVIEIGIYTGFIVFLFLYCKSPTRFLSLIGFIGASTALEIMNLTVFKGQGTRYPESLFYFPGYNFPVAIILFSAIYGGVISLISLKIVNFFNPRHLKRSLLLLIAAIFNSGSVFIEIAGVKTEYWIHQKANNIYNIWHFVYLFYFCVILGGIIFIFEEIKQEK